MTQHVALEPVREWFLINEVARDYNWNLCDFTLLLAQGRLPAYVAAEKWAAISEGPDRLEQALRGFVRVFEEDIPLNPVADHWHFSVERVRFNDRIWRLKDKPQKISVSLLYISRADLDRFLGTVAIASDQPFLDKAHPHYASELAIAVQAWRALCEPEGGLRDTKVGAKKQINVWLREHHRALTTEARQRIATVVNPDTRKRGGAPRSQ